MTDALPQSELNERSLPPTKAPGFVPGDEHILKAVQAKMRPPQDRIGSDIVMAPQDALDTEKPASPKQIASMWDDAWEKAYNKAQQDLDKGKSGGKPDPFSIRPDFSAVNKELEKAVLAAVDKPGGLWDLEYSLNKLVKTERSAPILKKGEDGSIEVHHIRQIRMSAEEQKFFDDRASLRDALELTVIGSGRLGYGKRIAPIYVIKPPQKPAAEGKTG